MSIQERQIEDSAIVSETEHLVLHDNLTGLIYTTDAIKTDKYLDLSAISTPANVAGRLYHKTTDGKIYFQNGSSEYDLTSSGGASLWTDYTTYISPDNTYNIQITDTGNLKVVNGGKIEAWDNSATPVQYLEVDGVDKLKINKIESFSGTLTIGGSGNTYIGDVGSPSNLIFEESATISGQGTNTITIGETGDTFNLAVAGVTYQHKASVRSGCFSFYYNNSISNPIYLMGKDSTGYTPPYAIHLTRLVVLYERYNTADSIAIEVYKNSEIVDNKVFGVSATTGVAGYNRLIDVTVDNLGMDAITLSDTCFIKFATGGSVLNVTIVLEYTIDN